MAKIFFSYAHEDRELMEKVKKELEEYHEIWFDDEILLGNPFPQAIDLAIESSDFFIVFLTAHSKKSAWVKRELLAYLVKDIENDTNTILPLKFDETNIRDFGWLLSSIQHCDFTKSFEAGIRDTLSRIGIHEQEETLQAAGKPNQFKKDIFQVSEDEYKRLLFSIDLAVAAGNAAMMYYNSSLKSNMALDERKNAATQADTAAQNKIIPLIHLRYENDTIISEESHKTNPYNSVNPNGYTWVIDPLDGTINFVYRIPFFCSAIGVLKNGLPFIGVIFDPVLNEVYFAIQGQPSKVWKISTGETIVISVDKYRETLDQSLIGTHVSSRPDVSTKLFSNDFFLDVSRTFKHVRAFGCGQLALAYVASGRLQAFMQLDSYIWDQVAGVVILENAGGMARKFEISSADLQPWDYRTKNILACSHEAILQAFREKFLRR